MDFSLFYQLKDNGLKWTSIALYVTGFALVIAVICYGVFSYQVYAQNQNISALDKKIAALDTPQSKTSEAEVLAYKKKIDDFDTIISSHKISSKVFSFIEENTLPDVWFSSFKLSEDQDQINLTGEAKDMQTLSNQVGIFEADTTDVSGITILSSETEQSGKVGFTLNISLNSQIFSY